MKKVTLMALAGALTLAANVNAQEMKKMDGKMETEHCMEMKDGKCTMPKAVEGKCGEGKCGATVPKKAMPKSAEGKCGEGKCGASK